MIAALDKVRTFLLRQKSAEGHVIAQSLPSLTEVKSHNVEDEFNQLKTLMTSKEWPEAVNPALIVGQTEENKIERAEGILDFLVDRSVANKRFLDFGCGEGHVAKVATSMGAIKSVGFDPVMPENAEPWKDLDGNSQKDGYILTTDLNVVRKNGPYDIILAYDSIEHADNMIDALANLKSVASPHAIIYLSFQPWIGRYGGVLYKEINKAFVHAVFTEDELKQLGITPKWKHKTVFPMATYRDLIKQVGLKIISERVEREPVEGYFERIGILRDRLMNAMPEGHRAKFPRQQLEQVAVEYILSL